MKLIKCLNAQWPTETVGIVDGATNPPYFYTVGYILQNKPSLLKRKVFAIRAANIGVGDKQEPVVVYYLGARNENYNTN